MNIYTANLRSIIVLGFIIALVVSCGTSKNTSEGKKLSDKELMEQAFARFNHDKAIAMARPLYEKKGDTTALKILGEAYLHKNMPDSAIFYFNQYASKGMTVEDDLMGAAIKKNRNWDEAIKYYQRSNNEAAILFCEMSRDQQLSCIGVSNELDACYEFDATESVDPERKDIIFNWKLGDGTQKTGVKVEHCYRQSGEYQVEFYVYDTVLHQQYVPDEQNLGMPNPYLLVVPPGFSTELSSNSRKKVGRSLELSVADRVEGMKYLWDMGDGTIYEGSEIVHQYKSSGSYNLRVYQLDGKTVTGCSGREMSIAGDLRWAN